MKRDMYGKAHLQAGQNDFLRSKAKKHASTVKSMEKKLDRLLDQEIGDPLDESKAAFDRLRHFIGEQHLPKVLIRLEKVTMSFGSETVFEDVNVLIKRCEKIGIIGPNGAGKSTLLKLIVNQLQPTKGKVIYSPSLSFGYFAQQLENINEENTIYEEVRVPDMEQGEIRKVLANFLFRKERVFTQIKNLSMGERCRVAFVKLLLQKHNVLVLDEMTNHMDIQSKECLEEALVHFPGCVIFVSHDQYFLKKLASKVIEVDNKQVQKISHSYKAYIEKKIEQPVKEGVRGLSEMETKKLQNRMAVINNRMSMINSRLSIGSFGEEERLQEEKDFFDLCQEMKKLKSLMG